MVGFSQMEKVLSFLKSAALLVASIILCSLLAEGIVRYSLFSAEDRAKGARQLWHSHHNNYTMQNGGGDGRCSLADSIVPNPFFVYSNASRNPCRQVNVNNIGLNDQRDFPFRPDPDFYDIVLLGGSVAGQMAAGPAIDPRSWLETELNKKYLSPSGKPFRVFSGSNGGWHYPNQLTFLSIYGDAMDAAVALDGVNEAAKASYRMPIFFPDPVAYTAAMRSLRYPLSTLAVIFTGDLRRFAFSNPVTPHSFLLYRLFMFTVSTVAWHFEDLRQEHMSGVGDFFNFPLEWTLAETNQLNRKKYSSYIQLLAAFATVNKMQYAHFVQPNRLIGKTLTEEEKQYYQHDTAAEYEEFAMKTSRELAARGIHTHLLTDVFQNEKGTIYGDIVHCKYDALGNNRGYEIMAEAMAKYLAATWHLKRK